jgi:hypothetical protein
VEYDIWDIPPDVTSGLFYRPAATGIRLDDERGVLLTGLIVTNNFPEDIKRINLRIEMRDSNSIILVADQTQILGPIHSGSSVDLLNVPIFAPTDTYKASITLVLQIYTSNYQGKITHVIP